MMLILFSNCKNSSTTTSDVPEKEKQIVTSKNEIDGAKKSSFIDESQEIVHETPILSDICGTLKTDYALLIDKINNHKEDKELISELIAWTKEPNHLDCLENNQQYNSFIEELNATL